MLDASQLCGTDSLVYAEVLKPSDVMREFVSAFDVTVGSRPTEG